MINLMALKQGDFVETVDLSDLGALEVPIAPARWFVLKVYAGREFKVFEKFRLRNVCAYLPRSIRTIARDTGRVARKPHLGRTVIEPLFPGLMLVPDFEQGWQGIEGVEGLLKFGPCTPVLDRLALDQVRQLERLATIPIGEARRLYAQGQLVRMTSGPFAGLEGRVERLDSKGRLTIFIAAMKRGAMVRTTEAQIEPVTVIDR